jgi:hypothetical protein
MKLPASFFPLPADVRWSGPRRGVFNAPFVFISPSLGRIEIEAGFDTDYASVPRGLWNLYPPDGAYSPAAWVHDYLYWYQALCEGGLPVARKQADTVFLEAMGALGIGWLTKSVLYHAVSFGGGKAWEENRRNRLGLPDPIPAPLVRLRRKRQ